MNSDNVIWLCEISAQPVSQSDHSAPPEDREEPRPTALDIEIQQLFRESAERMVPLLKEKLRTRRTGLTFKGNHYDTWEGTLLGTHLSATEAAAVYESRLGDIYMRLISPINDGIISFDRSELVGLGALVERWWYPPYPSFSHFLSFAGEEAANFPIAADTWYSMEDASRPWPRWLRALTLSYEP